MKRQVIHVSFPPDGLAAVRKVARQVGLSPQEVLRQAVAAGLPAVQRQFGIMTDNLRELIRGAYSQEPPKPARRGRRPRP